MFGQPGQVCHKFALAKGRSWMVEVATPVSTELEGVSIGL
jgi:hypothetical protein